MGTEVEIYFLCNMYLLLGTKQSRSKNRFEYEW